jgi:single stranded DNA-binding protein (ssb)
MIGNLTKDPETSTTGTGVKMCKFTIAVNRSYAASDGNRQTDFFPVICWRNTAENCGKFLKKGSKVGLSGSVQTRTYDASDGTKRYVTEIVADEVQFLSTRMESEGEPLPELPDESRPKKGKIEELKPIEDGDLPF